MEHFYEQQLKLAATSSYKPNEPVISRKTDIILEDLSLVLNLSFNEISVPHTKLCNKIFHLSTFQKKMLKDHQSVSYY